MQAHKWGPDVCHKLEREWLLPATLRLPVDGDDFRGYRTPRDWFVDVSAILLTCSWAVLVYLSVDFSLFNVVTGAFSCVAVWFRRRAPLVTAILLLPLAVASSMAAMAALIALFTVAVHRHFLIPVAVGLAHSVAQALYSAFVPGEWSNFPSVVLVYAAVLMFGMFVRARRQLVVSLNERVRQAEADAVLREERAQDLERRRIAREMHDVLGHRISLLSMHAGALEYRKDAEPEEVAQAASVIRGTAHQVLRDLRDVIGVLRDSPGESPPTLSLIHS
ncbi:sensor histidine kinase [Streptomyces boncukensis]|nr:histidine kinase [Streptomyces boncukensis]